MAYYISKQATVEDIQDFISWLETQSGTYDAMDPNNCPIAQYLRARGHTKVNFYGMYELMADGNEIDMPQNIGRIIYTRERIYSAALERAQATLTEMIYSIKPSEDPGAASFGEGSSGVTGIQDGTSTLTEGPIKDTKGLIKDDDATGFGFANIPKDKEGSSTLGDDD